MHFSWPISTMLDRDRLAWELQQNQEIRQNQNPIKVSDLPPVWTH